MNETDESLLQRIRSCVACAPLLPHRPRPIAQFSRTARLLIIGQAPGARVHASGVPWDDASGARLREWTGLPTDIFYDPKRVALVPMGLCYPGTANGADLPPRKECAPLWHDPILARLASNRLTLLVGSYSQKRYLGPGRRSLTEIVRAGFDAQRRLFPLPHPSWRSSLWMRRNPWFEADVLPCLQREVQLALGIPAAA